ncbi:hypothetical protein [Haladaptatus sp. NG-SE-30]
MSEDKLSNLFINQEPIDGVIFAGFLDRTHREDGRAGTAEPVTGIFLTLAGGLCGTMDVASGIAQKSECGY